MFLLTEIAPYLGNTEGDLNNTLTPFSQNLSKERKKYNTLYHFYGHQYNATSSSSPILCINLHTLLQEMAVLEGNKFMFIPDENTFFTQCSSLRELMSSYNFYLNIFKMDGYINDGEIIP